MLNILECKDFMKKNNLKSIIGFKEDEMDICVLKNGIIDDYKEIYKKGDLISVNGKEGFKIVGFCAKDNDSFQLIVVLKKETKGYARVVDWRTNDIKNITKLKSLKGTVLGCLKENGFKNVDGDLVNGTINIEIESDNNSIWFETENKTEDIYWLCLKENISDEKMLDIIPKITKYNKTSYEKMYAKMKKK